MSTTNDVISIYNSTGSMKAVHKETGLSETKIRKILITEGLYSSELGDEIQRLYESGISFEEICKK